jgi:DNA-binding MarR family transcriptional regulator
MILELGTFIDTDAHKAQRQWGFDAIQDYNKYSASTAKVLAELYKTSANLETTLLQSEIAERTGLSYAVVNKNLSFLVKEGFLKALSTSRKHRTYLIQQDKLSMLMAIFKAKRED